MSSPLELGPPSIPAAVSPPPLGALLLEAGLIRAADLAMALGRGQRLGSTLIAQGRVDPDVIARVLGVQAGVAPALASDLIAPLREARARVPDALCRELCAVPYQLRLVDGADPVLVVALRDPSDAAARARLERAAGMPIEPRIAAELVLRASLDGDAALDALAPLAPPTPLMPARGARRTPYLVGPRRGASSSSTIPPPPLPTPLAMPAARGGTAVGGGTLWPRLRGLVWPALVIGVLVWGAIALRNYLRPTTRTVGTSHHSSHLGLQVGFPEGAGWRVSDTRRLREAGLRAEYYYRGGIPEAPFTGLLLARVEADSAPAAAQRLLTRAVPEPIDSGCRASATTTNAVTCLAAGAVLPDNPVTMPRVLEIHAWPGDGDFVVAMMIDPDHTLSESELILGSITVD